MAPELHLRMPYSGNLVDLFASGIILFIMVSGHPPFIKADPRDNLYKLICTNKHESFWKYHEKNKKTILSQPLKNLINSMLAFDPTQRLSISEVIAHEWMKGAINTEHEIINEFNERRKKIEDRKHLQNLKRNKEINEINLKNTKFYQVPSHCKQFRSNEKSSLMFKLKNLSLEKREFCDLQVFVYSIYI